MEEIPFEVQSNCCNTLCQHQPYYVGGVNCQKCTYYEGEIEKENKVKCSHPETEDESTKEKK